MCDQQKIKIPKGYSRLVEIVRADRGKIVLGGYVIHYDRDGNEIGRTEPVDNVELSFDRSSPLGQPVSPDPHQPGGGKVPGS
jgi:hypothetical protein